MPNRPAPPAYPPPYVPPQHYYVRNMKEVAAYCGMGEAKAKSLLHRTRQKLRIYLEQEGFSL